MNDVMQSSTAVPIRLGEVFERGFVARDFHDEAAPARSRQAQTHGSRGVRARAEALLRRFLSTVSAVRREAAVLRREMSDSFFEIPPPVPRISSRPELQTHIEVEPSGGLRTVRDADYPRLSVTIATCSSNGAPLPGSIQPLPAHIRALHVASLGEPGEGHESNVVAIVHDPGIRFINIRRWESMLPSGSSET